MASAKGPPCALNGRWAGWLTGAAAALGIALMLILAASAWFVAAERPADIPFVVAVVGGWGAGLAWPAFALLTAATLAVLSTITVRRELGWRRGTALAIGTVAWAAAWSTGIRPPASRTGARLGFDARDGGELSPMADVRLPRSGWNGVQPARWPGTYTDFHHTRSYLLRVRGRLTGPGHYGWPPVMQYRLRVDSILEVIPRPAGPEAFQTLCIAAEMRGETAILRPRP
jgi:hypothetical protein